MPNELSYEVSLERSNQIRADLPLHPEKYTMLTGDRPTGRLHLGHYFGTLKSRVELQELGVHTNVLIADYQVITDRDSTDNIQDNVYNMVIDYLACGLDPDKTMIYAHSAVPACNQLMLPFLSLVSEALLQRNPTVKAEMEASGHELTGLLLTYPVHQACDILFAKGNVVPVGRDQLPHIELTRTIARKFNNRYGNVFPEVDALLSDTPLLPGLDGRKMSKSYGNAINISMTAEETARRIKKSQTDGERMITFDPEARPGVSGLLSTAAICTGRSEVEIAEEIGMGGSGALKKYVTESVNDYFAPIRARKGNVVPVGRDQLPHIELTRTIARKFNNRYGNVFPEVDALLSDTPLLPGLDGRKMSKSYGNAINISMTAEETARRIKKSQTDGERMITFDPEARPGVSGLLSTAAICTGRSEVEIAEEIGMGGSGALKKYVTESVNDYFAPIRARREELVQDMDYVKDVLREGNRRANEVAEATLAEVREAMGMVY